MNSRNQNNPTGDKPLSVPIKSVAIPARMKVPRYWVLGARYFDLRFTINKCRFKNLIILHKS